MYVAQPACADLRIGTSEECANAVTWAKQTLYAFFTVEKDENASAAPN